MPRVYNVSIYLDINTVSCPGVWLCPKGKAFLKISLFGVSDLTKEVDPFFPLVFKERFHFQKVFKNMNSVYELHDKLGRSIISLELLQCPIGSAGCVKLALFNALLSDILHPYATCFSRPLQTSGLELLFTACNVFPGIIAPKAEVSTKVTVIDSLDAGRSQKADRLGSRSVNDDYKRRQHKVCHSKNNTNCSCFQTSGDQSNDVKAYQSADSAQSERSVEKESFAVRESDRKFGKSDTLKGRYDKKNVCTSQHEKDSLPPRIKADDKGVEGEFHINREGENLSVLPQSGKEIGRLTKTAEQQRLGGRNYKNEDRSNQETVRSMRHRKEESPPGRRVGHQQEHQSRAHEGVDERYEQDRITSCERLMRNYGIEEMSRTNDEVLKGKYFRCYKERRVKERTKSQDNGEQDEPSENRGCTCSSYFNKKSKKSKKITIEMRKRQNSWEKLTGARYEKRPTGASVARSTNPAEMRDEHQLHEERESLAGEMPPKFGYRGHSRDKPRQIKSRSDMEVYSKLKYGDRSVNDQEYDGDQRHRFEAGEMLMPEYRDEYRERSGQRHPGYRRTSASVPGTGLGDRAYRYSKDSPGQSGLEPEFSEIPRKVLTNRQRAQEDGNRREDEMPASRDKDHPPRESSKPRPAYASKDKGESAESSSEQSEYESDGCKCPLCKSYQDVYKPRTHPCPRFRKTVGIPSKTRHPKSNVGPKKMVPSRRSKVSKTVIDSSRKPKSRPNQWGFVNCDTINQEFIDNQTGIQKFYKQT